MPCVSELDANGNENICSVIWYTVLVWLGGVTLVGRTGDQKVLGLILAQCTARYRLWASCSRTCASVTKQYNLVPVEGRRRFQAGKVTAGLVKSTGSLPPLGLWLHHLRSDCLETGISSDPYTRYWVWDTLSFLFDFCFILIFLTQWITFN